VKNTGQSIAPISETARLQFESEYATGADYLQFEYEYHFIPA
jgi:hypothetical protein